MRPSFTAIVCGHVDTATILQSLGARALHVPTNVLLNTLKASDSILEADVFVIEVLGGNALSGEPEARAMQVVAAIRDLPDYCTMRTGVRWKAIPIVILSRDDRLGEVIRFESRYKRLYACSFISGMEAIYQEIAKRSAAFARELLADMESVGWKTIRLRGRHHRSSIAIEPKRFGARERATPLYDLESDKWPRMSQVGKRMFSAIAPDDEGDAIAHDLNAYCDLIGRPGVKEADCQQFLEEHPHLFEVARHELFPHPIFLRENGEKIIPDFMVRAMPGFANTRPRLIEIKTPNMKLLTGSDSNRTIISQAAQKAIGQTRDYARWIGERRNIEQRSNLFGVPDDVRVELVAGMTSDAEQEILDRERRYNSDLRIRSFNELGDEMEHRHTASFPDFAPPEAGVRYVARSRPRLGQPLRHQVG